jgi:fatty acid desaturase
MNVPSVLYAPADFQELRKRITEAGLFSRRPAAFFCNVALVFGMLALSALVLFLTDLWYVQLLNAFLMAFASVQIAFIIHDVGHRQVFKAGWLNVLVAYISIAFVGGSAGWWIEKHNEHHAHPNHEDLDPDIHIPVLAFSEEQAKKKRGIFRLIVRYQAILFFPILALVSVSMRGASIGYLFSKPLRATWPDWIVLIVFPVLYFTAVFSALPLWLAILFVCIHQALFGFYLGSVFAPNHKGMMLIKEGTKIDFLREQVLTSRNVRSHPVVDFLYGGLNYQIEHHLFPYLPRWNLRKVNAIVKDFCKVKQIPYHETGIVQSYREILQSLHAIAQYTRPAPAFAQAKNAA